MAELNMQKLPHAMAVTGPLERARAEAWRLADQLVGDRRIGILSIEPENGLIKLEAAHRINSFLSLAKVTPARAIIVSEAQALNPQATNAILKIVEEPPADTYFFFLATEVSQFLPTLRSRLQVLRLPPTERVFDEAGREMRQSAVAFARSGFERRRQGLTEFLETIKDRESAHQAAYFLQLVLRDWSVGEASPGFPEWATFQRVELWRHARQLEVDLHAHVDRSLAFESFFYRAGEH